MKMTAKIALFSAAIVTMGSLAACQSNPQTPNSDHHMMKDGPRNFKNTAIKGAYRRLFYVHNYLRF